MQPTTGSCDGSACMRNVGCNDNHTVNLDGVSRAAIEQAWHRAAHLGHVYVINAGVGKRRTQQRCSLTRAMYAPAYYRHQLAARRALQRRRDPIDSKAAGADHCPSHVAAG